MNDFGKLFKFYRVNAGKTYKDVADYIGKSIGYLCDIEKGRKNPPDTEIVKRIESYLNVADQALVNLASKMKTKVEPTLQQIIKKRPQQMADLLYRADDLTDKEIEEVIKLMENRTAGVQDR
jgi:transcriptional regulator with XRE-family HTH domain